MRTSTLKLSILAFILCLGFSAHAQQTTYYNYNYPWTFGINGGLAWQYADVNGGAGYGLGIDLAKRIGGRENSWFALDARGRFTYARHYGQGYERVYNLGDYPALSPFAIDPVNNTGLGYAFHNHQTTMGELDLEGVITLNRLRERTGWTVQLFGGIGIGLYDVATDLDDGTTFYDYSLIDTTQSNGRIRRDIRDLRNRTYESAASGFENGIRGTIMPSLGLGIGYQFTPRFSMGLEHKATWAQADNLDGVIDFTSNRPDDVHHYTSLYMRWTLGEEKGREPIIDVTAPNRSPYVTQAGTGSIRANIKHVTRRSGVTVTLNGQRINYFDFNTATEEFFLTVPLVQGQNTVTIFAQNDYGSDQESVVFIYEYNPNPNPNPDPNPSETPPVVEIITPGNCPFTTNNNTIQVEAIVNNVNNQNDIQFTVNGYIINDFRFSGNRVTATVDLQDGNNVIEIAGSNSRGQVNDNCTVIYSQQQAPRIVFLSPLRSPYSVTEDSYSVRARIDNVDNNRNINFRVNGKSEPFSFKNGVLGSLIDLRVGTNIIEISAYNNTGTDEASTTIIFEQEPQPSQAPNVTITSPNENPHNTSNANVFITATTSNVDNKGQITLRVNGSNKAFNFNRNNGKINANINLIQGNNRVDVLVNTDGGKASDFVNIIYKKTPTPPVTPPKVTIRTPTANPAVSTINSALVTATVTGVTSGNDIQLLINGQLTTNFSYSTSSNLLKATVNLQQGNNTYRIIATNSGGTDEDGGSIVYKPQEPKQVPIITILNPKNNPHTTTTGVVNLSANIQYVSGRNDITVTVGGQVNNSFAYKNGILTLQLDVPKAGTIVEILATNADGQDKEVIRLLYNVQPTIQKPVVTITRPTKSPYTSGKPSYLLEATVTNVTNQNDITVQIGGKSIRNFTYANNIVKVSLTIPNGGTTVQITGENTAGSDTKTVRLNYNKPKQPPVITMMTPKQSPHQASTPTITIKARIQYVSGRNNVNVSINGQSYSGFTLLGENFTMPMDIAKNGSTVVITATNADGQDVETIRINYTAPVPKPTITVRIPQKAVVNTTNAKENLTVVATNTTSKSQISIKINNINFTNFAYNNGVVTAQLPLKIGRNTVIVTVQNSGGKASKTLTFNRSNGKVPGQSSAFTTKPTVKFTTPNKNGAVITTKDYVVTARVTDVANKTGITVKVNQRVIKNFTYNAKNQVVSFKGNLQNGNNTVTIIAKNTKGVTTASTILTLKAAAVEKPSGRTGN
jgi:hypothetical protein